MDVTDPCLHRLYGRRVAASVFIAPCRRLVTGSFGGESDRERSVC